MASRYEPVPEHWVDKLFARFSVIYGHKWTSVYPNSEMISVAKREWARALGRVTGEQIQLGIEGLIDSGEPWPPTIPEFITVCKNTTLKAQTVSPKALPKPRPEKEVLAGYFAKMRDALK